MEDTENPRAPAVGVVKPIVLESNNPYNSDSSCPPQIINQEQLIMMAQQMGTPNDISALTEAISNLNITLLKAVHGSLTTKDKESQARPREKELEEEQRTVLESEDEFKDASEDGFNEEERVSKQATTTLLEAVLKTSPPPPPPPPPPIEVNVGVAVPSSALTKEDKKVKELDQNKPAALLRDQLKKALEDGMTLKKIQRPEKKPDVQETQEFSIKVKLRSVRKSDSSGDKENNPVDNAVKSDTTAEEKFPRLRKSSTKQTEGEPASKSPTRPEEILLSQVTEARKRMKKVRKTENQVENKEMPNDEVKPIQAPVKSQPQNPNPKRRNTSEPNESKAVEEVTVAMQSRRKSSSSSSDKIKMPQPPRNPMEDHMKNFFAKKKAKAEVKSHNETDTEYPEKERSLKKVEHPPNATLQATINGIVEDCSEKANTNENETLERYSGITKAISEELNPTTNIDSHSITNNDDSSAVSQLSRERPKPSTKPKPVKSAAKFSGNKEINDEKCDGEKLCATPPTPQIPVPPPPPPQPSNTTFTETSFSSKRFKEVKVSEMGSTQTTYSSYTATSSMTATGQVDKGELLSAIKGFNKSFLKKVTEAKDETKNAKKDNAPMENKLEEEIKKAIQKISLSINGDGDSDSENGEDSDWESNDWEE